MRAWLTLIVFLGVSCGPDLEGEGEESFVERASELLSGERVRVVAGNLSANGQDYDSGPGQRILQGLKPDIALLQELNVGDNSATAVGGFVSATFGADFQYVRGGSREQIPNGVVSRYPIRTSGTWADPRVNGTRGFTWALIDAPGEVDVFAVSVHLATSSSGTRAAEAADLVNRIHAEAPPTAYVVIGGDLNTTNRNESALGKLRSVVVTSGPWPTDGSGNSNTNASRRKPYDWVLASSSLEARRTATVVGATAFANGLVVDTRRYNPLADLAPARKSDSGAPGMQHMAVVRDFVLPTAP